MVWFWCLWIAEAGTFDNSLLAGGLLPPPPPPGFKGRTVLGGPYVLAQLPNDDPNLS